MPVRAAVAASGLWVAACLELGRGTGARNRYISRVPCLPLYVDPGWLLRHLGQLQFGSANFGAIDPGKIPLDPVEQETAV